MEKTNRNQAQNGAHFRGTVIENANTHISKNAIIQEN